MLGDSRVQGVSYVSEEDASNRLVFLINPTPEEVEVKMEFTDPVKLAALPQLATAEETAEPLVGKTFELVVPPHGILSMRQMDVAAEEVVTTWT
jgi:hypothetical protein